MEARAGIKMQQPEMRIREGEAVTKEERGAACDKFLRYLSANDAHPIGFTITFSDGHGFGAGSPEVLQETLVHIIANRLGLTVKEKP
jgi:hypothetical protein